MNQVETLEGLLYDGRHQGLGKAVGGLQQGEELAGGGVLGEEVDVGWRVEEAVEGDYVQVFQGLVDADLPAYLVGQFLLFYKGFFYCFHCADEIRQLVAY